MPERPATGADQPDPASDLEEISHAFMPFGMFGPAKYPPNGVPIMDLPIEYLAWFETHGFPKGKLGRLMRIVYETRACGCDGIFDPLRQRNGGRFRLHARRRKEWEFGDS